MERLRRPSKFKAHKYFLAMAAHPGVAPVNLSARQSLLHQLFGDHHGWLLYRLRVRSGCPSDAADLASETFVQVVALDDPHSIREPRALLTTIAKQLLYASWRRRDLERAYLLALGSEPLEFAPSAEQQALVGIDRLLERAVFPRSRRLPVQPA